MSEYSRKSGGSWATISFSFTLVTFLVSSAQAQTSFVDEMFRDGSILDGSLVSDELPGSYLLAQNEQADPAPAPELSPPPTVPFFFGPFGFFTPGLFQTPDEPPQLASVPDAFGDFHGGINYSQLPVVGLFQRMNISESNKALPVNRVFFLYNHFHNATRIQRDSPGSGSNRTTRSTDSYVLGAERVFDDGFWSVEVRIPFTNELNVNDSALVLNGGNFGNVSITLKRLLHETQTMTVAAGLGILTPTGDDLDGATPLTGNRFEVKNEALHFVPFIGFLSAPSDRVFYQGFFQIDIASKGNPVRIENVDSSGNVSGSLNEQTLLSLDASAGYWLFRDSQCPRYGLTGLAAILEFHYTTALQETDEVHSVAGMTIFGNPLNRFDVVNMTLGLNAQLGEMTDLRLGGVFPLRNSQNRFFDSEIQASLIHRY